MRGAVVLAVVLVGCIPQGSGEQELRSRVPGTWTGTTPDGVKLTMQLRADGSGEVNGHAGSWEIKIGRILLSDGEHMVPCDLDGNELSCHTPDGDLVMTRATGEVAAAPPEQAVEKPAEPAKPFAPEKTVPGQPFIAPANSPIGGASFTTPDGWTHGGEKVGGKDMHAVTSAAFADARILIGREPGRADDLRASVLQMLGETQYETVIAPESIELSGQRASRAVIRKEGREYYGALIEGSDGTFLVLGSYPADQAEAMRPVVETVLSSFRTSP
jgi:hypothetical protein